MSGVMALCRSEYLTENLGERRCGRMIWQGKLAQNRGYITSTTLQKEPHNAFMRINFGETVE
jgi:hypothetical protein